MKDIRTNEDYFKSVNVKVLFEQLTENKSYSSTELRKPVEKSSKLKNARWGKHNRITYLFEKLAEVYSQVVIRLDKDLWSFNLKNLNEITNMPKSDSKTEITVEEKETSTKKLSTEYEIFNSYKEVCGTKTWKSAKFIFGLAEGCLDSLSKGECYSKEFVGWSKMQLNCITTYLKQVNEILYHFNLSIERSKKVKTSYLYKLNAVGDVNLMISNFKEHYKKFIEMEETKTVMMAPVVELPEKESKPQESTLVIVARNLKYPTPETVESDIKSFLMFYLKNSNGKVGLCSWKMDNNQLILADLLRRRYGSNCKKTGEFWYITEPVFMDFGIKKEIRREESHPVSTVPEIKLEKEETMAKSETPKVVSAIVKIDSLIFDKFSSKHPGEFEFSKISDNLYNVSVNTENNVLMVILREFGTVYMKSEI